MTVQSVGFGSGIETMWDKIKTCFTKHELWALERAEKQPSFSIFFVATLWVWAILLWLLIIPVLIIVNENWPQIGTVFIWLLHLLFLFFALWTFRWYFICVGLMYGKGKMASTKKIELLEKLKILN